MKAMVVDDESLTAEYICRLLAKEGVEVSGCYTNPFEALHMVNILKPDVLFLDIEMPEISGLELAERVYASEYDCEIVFITAYNQYAINAFSVNALDYLLKPIMIDDLHRAVARVRKRRAMISTGIVEKETHKKIKISMFGKLSLYAGNETKPIRWYTSKCAEVFAFMLLPNWGREVSKWKIIENIWSDKDSEKGDINLRSTISRLNKTLRENDLGITLTSTGNGYRLYLKDVDLEVDAFKLENLVLEFAEVTPENVKYYESIVLSYRDMLLEEFSSEWCEVLRETYHRYFMSAANKLVKYYEKTGVESFKILNIIELMIKYEPYDENIRKNALKLYYKIGGKKSIENYFKEYCHLLMEDLGVKPAQTIKNLYKSLINQ